MSNQSLHTAVQPTTTSQTHSMPPWKVLLHNDDENTGEYVVLTITQLTPLDEQEAIERMLEADDSDVSMLLCTHQERAELYQEQFTSKGLTVTIEPDEQE